MSDNPNLSGKVGLDVTDFKTAISEMNRSIRVIESGFRASAAALGDWSQDASGLELRIKALTDKIGVQQQKVAALRGEYERVAAEKGKNSRAAQDLEIKLNRETETLNKMQRELGETQGALDKMGDEADKAGKDVGEMGKREDEAARSSGRLQDALSRLNGGLKNAASGFRDLGTKVLGAVKTGLLAIAAAATAAVGGMVVLGKKATEEASNLNEALNASGTVFEEAAGKIQAFGRTAADTAGLAASEFNQMAAVTGAMLQNYGLGADAAADETINLTQRAADMASIFNTDVGDALGAIQALLRGEADPIERFGVSISAAAVNAKALELGLADSSGEISKQAQLTARLALFYEQTDKIAGDFVKTSDQEANARRVAAAQWKNFLATIGSIGLPILNKFWSAISEKVLPVLNSFANYIKAVVEDGDFLNDFLADIPKRFQPLVKRIGEVVAAFKEGGLRGGFEALLGKDFVKRVVDVANAIKKFVTETLIPFVQTHAKELKGAFIAIGAVLAGAGIVAAIAAITNPITLLVAAVGLLGAAWAGNWGGIRDKTQEIWTNIQPVLQTVWDWLKVNIPNALETLRSFWSEKAWPAIQNTIQTVWPIIQNIFNSLKDFILNTLIPTVSNLYTQWTTVWWPTIQTVTENVWTVLETIFTEIGRWINDNIVPWIEYLKEVWSDTVWPALQKAVEDMWLIVGPIWEAFQAWLEEKLPPALTGMQGTFENVMEAIDEAIQPVKTLWDNFAQAVKNFWDWISGKTFDFKIKIPDLPKWALPGSPLPIHTAWKNFAEDMERLASRIPDAIDGLTGQGLEFGGVGVSSIRGLQAGGLTLAPGAITIQATVANDMDMYVLARRVADEIQRRQRG